MPKIKNVFILASLLAVFILIPTGILNAQTAPTNGLVGYWTFDEGSGTTASDSSGNGNTGTLTNGPTWTSGQIGGALSFDGVNDVVEIDSVSSLKPSTVITVSAWVKLKVDATAFNAYIIAFDNINYAYHLSWTDAAPDRFIWRVRNTNGVKEASYKINPKGVWVNVVGTFDGTTQKIYTDGVERDSIAVSGNIDYTFASQLNIGAQRKSNIWDGTIDDVRIYNRALSTTEIADIYNAGIGVGTVTTYQCSDSIDNDSDGLTDYPNDPGCTSTTDNDEYNAVSDTTPPTTPTNLQATTNSSSQISLTWSASTDNTATAGYRVYRNGTQITTTTNTSYTDNSLSAGTLYTYTVSAYDAAGNVSSQSTSVSATTNATAVVTTVSLSASPTTVTSGNNTTLTWSSTNANSCTAGGNWTGTKTTSGTETIGPITSSLAFTLTCTGTGGSATASVNVSVGTTNTTPTSYTGKCITVSDLDNLPAGAWCEVPNSRLKDVAPYGWSANVINPWSGGAYDTKRNRLIVWGGGHRDYAGNEVYTFNINTLKWERLTDPSPNVGGTEVGGLYPDGLPRSRHTYDYIEYASNVDKFLVFGAGGTYPSSQVSDSNTYSFDFDKLKWDSTLADVPGGGNRGTTAYNPADGTVWLQRLGSNGTLLRYNPINNSWTEHAKQSMSIYAIAAIDYKRNNMVSIGSYSGSPQVFKWDLLNPDNKPINLVPLTTGNKDLEGRTAPGFVYDITSDKFVAWDDGPEVYLLDPETWAWSKVSPIATNKVVPTSAPKQGTYGRFQYVPFKNVFVLVNGTNENVYFYKLSSGAGSSSASQDTTPPTTPTNLQATTNSSSQISLTWSASTDNTATAGYRVYRNGTQITTTTNTSYTDNSLSAGTLYTYTVSAYDAAGNVSSQSTSVSAATNITISTKFNINDTIEVSTRDGSSLNVRGTANGILLGQQLNGRRGIVIGGPTVAGGLIWWNINFNNAPDGWVAEGYITASLISGNSITIGTLESDPPTIKNLGVSLPIISGDNNYNAQAFVSYRKQGVSAWNEGLPLLRVRPDKLSTDTQLFTVVNQFAGSIFNLEPDTSYEFRVRVVDSDGVNGNSSQIITMHTRPYPKANPLVARIVNVSTMTELRSAVASAKPGDVITLANNTYNGSITINNSGTADNPIILRGQSQVGVIIDASGALGGIDIAASHVYVENLTVTSSDYGIRMPSDAIDVVVRFTRLTNVNKGIKAKNYSHRNFYICDNVLEGKSVWPDTSKATWDMEGIVITGSGHVVCNNTLSGFGDSIGFSRYTNIPNLANDFYGNEVLWGGDDGIELDEGQRNIRAYRNRILNTASGISMQPVWGGPTYIFQNIFYNQKNAPYKLNNAPSGFYIFNNTAVRVGWAWKQYSNRIMNFQFFNNLTVGTDNGVDMSSVVTLGEIDYNGWYPDGQFRFGTRWNSFSDLQARSPFETNGRLLTSSIFQNDIPILTETAPDKNTFRAPVNLTLSSVSNAVDAGRLLPNINNDYIGSGPDLGALERGKPVPIYGARTFDTTAPTTPIIIKAKAISGFQADLSWTKSVDPDSGISGYNIYRNGLNIGFTSQTNYRDSGLQEFANYRYQVSAINRSGLEGSKSIVVNTTTSGDITPPRIESVNAATDLNKVTVVFSEQLNSIDAQTVSNYSINNNIQIIGAVLENNQTTVTLTTTSLSKGINYTLTVNNITDSSVARNMIIPNSQVYFTYIATLLISDIFPATYQRDSLVEKKEVYIDRTYTYTNVPSSFKNFNYLRTANNDKSATGGNFLSFTVNQPVTVYVAYDVRILTRPSWLSSWVSVGAQLKTTDTTLRLYRADFSAGTVTLGGNEGGGGSMYTVLVSPYTGESVISTPQPTPTPADTTPPTITTPTITTTINSATITFTTNETATAYINYGLSSAYSSQTNTHQGATHTFTLSNLSDNTTYNYRTTAADQANNTTQSINRTFTTKQAIQQDTTPPSQTTNLSSSNITQTSVDLTWTASGDNNMQGQSSSYDIRYSATPLTNTNYTQATQATGEPTPKQAGQTETAYIAVGLQPNTTYYFALKTTDEANNTSPLSNIITITTLDTQTQQEETQSTGSGSSGGGTQHSSSGSTQTSSGGGGGGIFTDTTPPKQASNTTTESADRQITLKWNNPKDNDFARIIIIRKEGSKPTSQTDGTTIYEGTNEEYTDINLNNNKKYYYAIYTYDKKPNYSSPIYIEAQPKEGKTQIQTKSTPIKEGDLIRGPDGIKVYIINQYGYKRHIFNPVVFEMYGHLKWEDIKEVSQQTLDSFTTSDFYQAENDYRVFSLKEINEKEGFAQKRWMNLPAQRFLSLGYNWKQVFTINEKERDYYQEGTPLTEQELER